MSMSPPELEGHGDPLPPAEATGLSTTSMVLGIAALATVLCFFILSPPLAIAAVICGHIARSKTKSNPAAPGRSQALAGVIMGYLALAFFAALLLYVLTYQDSMPSFTPQN